MFDFVEDTEARHNKVFELLRQNSIAEATAERMAHRKDRELNHEHALEFLARAQKSFKY
ncbi:MAG: hypothetical protein AAFR68_09700 [Pseudomonadota bacterium]